MSDPQRRPEPYPDEAPPHAEMPATEPFPPAPPPGREPGPIEKEPVDVRQGTTLGQTRYILAASLFTIAIIFLILWLVIARL